MPTIQIIASGPPETPDRAGLPHVLLVLDGFPQALGGGERVVLRMAALLPKYGYRVSILTLSLHPESAFQAASAPCPVYLLPLQNAYGWEAWRGALVLRRFLRKESVRIVQTFFESSDLWAGLVTRLGSSAKLVWSRRDMGILRGRKHRWAYRALRFLPHAVAAVSQRVAELVIRIDGVPAGRVHVIYNGLDLPSATTSREQWKPGAPATVLTVGNLRHVKGHDVLLQAAAQVLQASPETRFQIAGEVLEKSFVEALLAQRNAFGMENSFQLLGKRTDLPDLLAGADVFVLPSRSEGFSNALVEAMALGLPCVATDVGGNAEAIDTEQNGLIVPAEDAADLARAILRILQDPMLATQLSVAAREKAAQAFSSDAMMKRVVALFRLLDQA